MSHQMKDKNKSSVFFIKFKKKISTHSSDIVTRNYIIFLPFGDFKMISFFVKRKTTTKIFLI